MKSKLTLPQSKAIVLNVIYHLHKAESKIKRSQNGFGKKFGFCFGCDKLITGNQICRAIFLTRSGEISTSRSKTVASI